MTMSTTLQRACIAFRALQTNPPTIGVAPTWSCYPNLCCFPISGFLMILRCNAKSESLCSLILPPRCQYPGWASTFVKSRQVRNCVISALGMANRPPKIDRYACARMHLKKFYLQLLLFSIFPLAHTAARHETAPPRCVPHYTWCCF